MLFCFDSGVVIIDLVLDLYLVPAFGFLGFLGLLILVLVVVVVAVVVAAAVAAAAVVVVVVAAAVVVVVVVDEGRRLCFCQQP